MAIESSAIVGSGVSVLREQQGVRVMRGTNSVLSNYEDINSLLGVSQSSGLAVGSSAIQLTGPENRLRGRRKVLIQNLGADPAYIGGSSGLTTNTGVRVASGELLTLDVLDYGHIWVISGGASDVRVMELR